MHIPLQFYFFCLSLPYFGFVLCVCLFKKKAVETLLVQPLSENKCYITWNLGMCFGTKSQHIAIYRTSTRPLWKALLANLCPSRCCWTASAIIPEHWLELMGTGFQPHLEGLGLEGSVSFGSLRFSVFPVFS